MAAERQSSARGSGDFPVPVPPDPLKMEWESMTPSFPTFRNWGVNLPELWVDFVASIYLSEPFKLKMSSLIFSDGSFQNDFVGRGWEVEKSYLSPLVMCLLRQVVGCYFLLMGNKSPTDKREKQLPTSSAHCTETSKEIHGCALKEMKTKSGTFSKQQQIPITKIQSVIKIRGILHNPVTFHYPVMCPAG